MIVSNAITKFLRQSNSNYTLQLTQKTKPHICIKCGIHIKTKNSLSRHMKIHDTHRTFHSCTLCDKKYFYMASLKQHIRSTHEGNQKHPSDEKFSEKQELVVHASKPTGGELYTCTECDQTFTEIVSRNRHIKSHNQEESLVKAHVGEKSHSCTVCKQHFMSGDELNTHMRSHVVYPHVCPTCGKGFRLSASLRNHVLSHKGDIPQSSDIGKANV
jgi:KRAB domain-containing zinc finger protein